jgi:hypothetical protein
MSQLQVLSRLGATPRGQRGVVVVLFTIAMLAMLGLTGLALDGAHAMLNKTRLQNSVDAAALSAAKTLDETDDRVAATVEALAMFTTNASGAGNAEIAASYSSGQLTVSVQYSTTLHPFVPATVPERYVRVTATNLRLPGWFIPVMGIDEMIVGASAVAGPSPIIDQACNIAPMMVCGIPNNPAAIPPVENFGYALGVADVLKASTNSFEVGAGNFQLIRLDGGQGAADLRDAMAGAYEGCLTSGTTIPTEPGNTVGPVVQGLNTRFGIYSGPVSSADYTADVNTTAPGDVGSEYSPLSYEDCEGAGADSDIICWDDEPVQPILPLIEGDPITYDFYDYEQYFGDLAGVADPTLADPPTTAYGRRTMAVPVGDCSTTTDGQGDVLLLGFLCYHLLQPAEQHGNRSQVYGQFIEKGCPVTGVVGPLPNTGPGPYIIQLYKDETAEAS